MTRKDIRDKYNIVCLERPERANKELSNGEAKKYEKNQKLLIEKFHRILAVKCYTNVVTVVANKI